MGWIIEKWSKEWPIVKKAPCSFISIVLISFIGCCASMFFIYRHFISPGKDTHIEMLRDQINKQEKQGAGDAGPVTKQEIRTCLESINPEILQRIDEGRKEILVCISSKDVVEITNLSKCMGFDNYLSFRQATLGDDFDGLDDPNVYIENYKYQWVNNGYYFYPKDALINSPF